MRSVDGDNQTLMLLFFLSLLFFGGIIGTEAVSNAENAAMIVGEAVSPSGPVPYQKISLQRHEDGLFSKVSNTSTDAAGRYSFENLPLNSSFILELRYNGTRHFKAVTTTKPIVRADFNLIGTLTVKVTHLNHTSIKGLPVYLEGLPGVILVNKTTDENGVAGFDHLDLNETYRVSFTFQGVPYYEDVSFRESSSIKVNFTVYETTMSDEDIKISLHYLFVKLEEDHLSIIENIIYRNDGVKVFNNSWLKASLPKGRFDFATSIMDCCLKELEDGILFDPMDPIKPGGKFQLWMEYKIDLSSSESLFKRRIDYDTDSFYFFFDDTAGADVRSTAGLISKGTVKVGKTNYNLLVGSNLEAGTYIIVELSWAASSQESGWQIMIGTILLAIPVGYYVTSILTKKMEKKSVKDLEEEKVALFKKLLKLDSEYDAGKISKEKYEKIKSKYKKRVIEVMRQIDKFKDAQMKPPVPSSQMLKDLYAEEHALTSTLEKLEADFKRGLVSEDGYRKIKARFEDRRTAVRKKIEELEKMMGKKRMER